MKNTLIISETHYGTAKKVADIAALILGNSRSVDISNVPKDISKYSNIILVFSFYGFYTAKKIKDYLACTKDMINNKKVVSIGVGLSEKDNNDYTQSIESAMGKKVDLMDFVQGELKVNVLTEDDKKIIKGFLKKTHMKLTDMGNFDEKKAIEVACSVARILNKPDKGMNKKELLDEINKFILDHNTCTLATGSGDFTRNTPIEHIYFKNNFYFISEGGFKFKGILQNSNVCIAIFNNYTSMSDIKGLQISGKSKLVPYLSKEYIELMDYRGLNIETIKNLPISLNLIKVAPEIYEFLNTDFKKKGGDSKQYFYV